MPVTAPPSINALPTAPDPNDRSTFNARAYPWSAALPTWTTQVQAVAANVAANATDAAGSATAASGSATTAGSHATTAGTHATNASTSAGQAAANAVTAAQRLADMEALYDQFDDRYLGVKASDPTVDNDGNPLQAGAIYVNSASGFLRAFNGTAWVQGISALAGVESLNGLQGALQLKTINGQALTGAGDVSAQTPHFLLMAQGVI